MKFKVIDLHCYFDTSVNNQFDLCSSFESSEYPLFNQIEPFSLDQYDFEISSVFFAPNPADFKEPEIYNEKVIGSIELIRSEYNIPAYGYALLNLYEKCIEVVQDMLNEKIIIGAKLEPYIQKISFKKKDRSEIMEKLKNVTEKLVEKNKLLYISTGLSESSMPTDIYRFAKQFPNLKVILGHAGHNDGYIEAVNVMKKKSSLLLETSMAPAINQLRLVQKYSSSRRILFGSSTPLSDIKYELSKILLISEKEEDLRNMLDLNAQSLLEAMK